MMKLKILKRFHDKETGEIRNVGEVIEVSDERATEILKSPLKVADVEEVGTPDNPEPQNPEPQEEKASEVQTESEKSDDAKKNKGKHR